MVQMLKVTIALDESSESLAALEWASKMWRHNATFQLVTVVLPLMTLTPAVPVGAEPGLLSSSTWTPSSETELRAAKVVEDANTYVREVLKVPRDHVSLHVLRPAGGVGHAIVDFVRETQPNVLVMGSRSMNGIQRTFMGLVGAGSVSDYVLHNVNVPVLAVHWHDKTSSSHLRSTTAPTAATATAVATAATATASAPGAATPPAVDDTHGDAPSATPAARSPGRQVVVALDNSDASLIALHWAFKHVLQPDDELHLLSLAPPAPLPVLDEASELSLDHDLEQHSRSQWDFAQGVVARAAAIAQGRGIAVEHIVRHCCRPQGGASGVGESITRYVSEARAHLVVLGSRGLGAVQAALMSLVGFGSVSEYVMHNASCPVLIVKYDSLSLCRVPPPKVDGAGP